MCVDSYTPLRVLSAALQNRCPAEAMNRISQTRKPNELGGIKAVYTDRTGATYWKTHRLTSSRRDQRSIFVQRGVQSDRTFPGSQLPCAMVPTDHASPGRLCLDLWQRTRRTLL
jgi:hypothetical protein